MHSIYGDIDEKCLNDYKKKLHSKIHWLLIYKESDDCLYFKDYFNSLLRYINALNNVLDKNAIIMDLLVTLQMAYDESNKKDYSYKTYRKYVLDAHNIVDKL